MTKVSFYLFEKSAERQVTSTCRLCRKILKQTQQKIWIYCPDPSIQQQLDDALWQFDPLSFLPHGIEQPAAPICISAHLPTHRDTILFNFAQEALAEHSKYSHIIEIVENEEAAKVLGREKFKYYRKLGLQPTAYKL
jgi:DNA polymerase-3 subunit chi